MLRPGAPLSEITVADHPLGGGNPLRPALWHMAALGCAGYRCAIHEFKLDATGQQWRTWHISPQPVIIQPDPILAGGSAELVNSVQAGKMQERHPKCPYLAAFHGARNFDILALYAKQGGAAPVSVPVAPGKAPVARLVPQGSQDALAGNTAVLTPGVRSVALCPDLRLAAAMITLGFPFDGCNEAGIPRIMAVGQDFATGESLLCEEIKTGTARQAFIAIFGQLHRTQAQTTNIINAPLEGSTLAPDHLYHWAAMAALRVEGLHALVNRVTGSDSAALRSHVFKSKSTDASVVATADEFEQNRDRIIRHLR